MLERKTVLIFFFFNDTATTEIYTLSLHDALPILPVKTKEEPIARSIHDARELAVALRVRASWIRSEEHTSELQSPCNLVCRLLLEKKKKSRPSLLADQDASGGAEYVRLIVRDVQF